MKNNHIIDYDGYPEGGIIASAVTHKTSTPDGNLWVLAGGVWYNVHPAYRGAYGIRWVAMTHETEQLTTGKTQ